MKRVEIIDHTNDDPRKHYGWDIVVYDDSGQKVDHHIVIGHGPDGDAVVAKTLIDRYRRTPGYMVYFVD